MLITKFLFPQKISKKVETKYKKYSFTKVFILHSGEREKKSNAGWTQLNTLPLQSCSEWLSLKKMTFFLFHTGAFGCLQATWINCGCSFIFLNFILFFCSHVWDGWGLQVRFCHTDNEWWWYFFFFLRTTGRHQRTSSSNFGPSETQQKNWGWTLWRVERRAALS